MATTTEVDRYRLFSGYIQYDGSTYSSAGNVNGLVGYEKAGITTYEYRAFANFQTNGVIPGGNVCTKLEFFWNLPSTPYEDPTGSVTDWITEIYVGTFIGSFSGNSSEWNGGTLAATYDWSGTPASDTYIDLGSVGVANYNNAGDTDIKLVDINTNTGLVTYWYIGMDNGLFAARRCKLRITYDVPSIQEPRKRNKPGLGKVIFD